MVSCISKGRMANFSWVAMTAFRYALRHRLDFHIQDKSLADHLWPLYYQHLQNPNWDPNLPTVHINDDKHTFTELPFEEEWRDKNIIIGTSDINTGYFQSFKYLLGYEQDIRETFDLQVSSDQNTCAIHLRAGDYKNFPTRHPIITKEYLSKSIEVIMSLSQCKWFFVYTDDVDYAAPMISEIAKTFPQLHFSIVVGGSEMRDFKAIMAASHVICSNSSFSVLASVLNPNPFKVVVCPHEDNYYGPDNKHLDVSTMMPQDWIRVKY